MENYFNIEEVDNGFVCDLGGVGKSNIKRVYTNFDEMMKEIRLHFNKPKSPALRGS
jgi:hypothetical protein